MAEALPGDGARYILTLGCPDERGIVAAVAGYLASQDCNILESAQYDDLESGRFFMRVVVASEGGVDLPTLRGGFAAIARRYGMDWRIDDAAEKVRTILMVSRFGHCLNDLLFRHATDSLPLDIVAIVSNHRDFEGVAATAGIPFHHIPVTRETKAEAEAALMALYEAEEAELVVLARYMQVLSDELSTRLAGRIINIHHSFLPSFKGAKPYHQAHARGVKLIGATAHYVTADLDEGPIIEQEVTRISHATTAEQMVAAGRDIESIVLARAVSWHAERRVLLNGMRTVVFR
ncbi:formyltetrahydrofolate deformylase [Sphingomonas oleivorans]|uniref:Formyltetrahydrofolate deformylase n=1 Tax=Sphingomonas oleivorans TaxID=1735121 RepID=A0A2T5G2L0_9SPHN|nr:formyltetrahydrofolate deformylase [Sphingomonas oleivorans]PTQ13375.1 formyltetrahydrofolate deformylase [Sphingomonas oleivorans]